MALITRPISALEQEIKDSFHIRKRIFIGLITATSVLVCLLLILLWVIPFIGLRNIHPLAPWIMGGLFGALIVFIAWAALGLVLNIVLGRSVLFSSRIRGLTIKLFLPLMVLFGRFAGLTKEQVRASFIRVNNELVRSENKRYKPQDILLLLPHCLQNSHCKHRLTYTIDNCKRCGECPIAELLNLRDSYGVHMAIATGGTIARRIVVQTRPKLILAVACERDLSSGIQDTYPIPVFGVLNERPLGPCLDTRVPLAHVEWALNQFIDRSQSPHGNKRS